jgi:hypothetical protein
VTDAARLRSQTTSCSASSSTNHILLADVGLGDGPVEPLPIREGTHAPGWRSLRLERLPENWWRVHTARPRLRQRSTSNVNPPTGECRGVRATAAHETRFPDLSRMRFCIRHLPNSTVALIGRVLKTVEEKSATTRLLHSVKRILGNVGRDLRDQNPGSSRSLERNLSSPRSLVRRCRGKLGRWIFIRDNCSPPHPCAPLAAAGLRHGTKPSSSNGSLAPECILAFLHPL